MKTCIMFATNENAADLVRMIKTQIALAAVGITGTMEPHRTGVALAVGSNTNIELAHSYIVK
jgi:hypothetical protein